MKPLRIVLMLALPGIAAVVFWCLCSSAPQKVSLAGGLEMRILKVSLGTNHVLSFEPLWKQLLRRALPESLQKPLGPFQGEHRRTRGESLVVWVDSPKKYAGTPFVLQKAAAVFR